MNYKLIFVDSSYFIARLLKNDKFHVRAIELEPKLNEKRYINNTVLVETLDSFISCGGQNVEGLFNYLNDMNDLVFLNEKDYFEAMDLFGEYGLSISFSNCTILQSMKKLGIDKIASFDDDFSKIEGLSVIR